MPTGYMATKGLFIAIILGLINGYVYQWFINRDIRIKLPKLFCQLFQKFQCDYSGAVLITFWLIVLVRLMPFLYRIYMMLHRLF